MARRKQNKGLGDVVESITEATGIKKAVHFIAGEDCGCHEIQRKFNINYQFARRIVLEAQNKYGKKKTK